MRIKIFFFLKKKKKFRPNFSQIEEVSFENKVSGKARIKNADLIGKMTSSG